MRIIVCVKAVPDPKQENLIKIDPLTGKIQRGNVPFVLNPFDRYALEAAVQIKEKIDAYIAVISMGPPAAENIVRECLALGADEGFLLSDPAFAGADAFATAYTLSKGIGKIGHFDVIFCGMASSDGSTELVGPELAAFLDIPVITRVMEINHSLGLIWELKTADELEYRRIRVCLPAVITVTRELNNPRALSFSGVLKAKQKKLNILGIKDLAIAEEFTGSKGSPTTTKVSQVRTPQSQRKVEFLTGTREEIADQLIQKLKVYGFE